MTISPSLAEPTAGAPSHLAEHALLDRIITSRHFAKSGLLSRFLRHVCESHLAGRACELTEQQIGVHVFGRPAGYDCGTDNIVRNYARQLRNRLDDYYRWEGRGECLRLEVPRGGYKPVFASIIPVHSPRAETFLPTIAASTVPAAHTYIRKEASEKNGATRDALRSTVVALSVLTVALLVAVLTLLVTRHRTIAADPSPMHSFWATVFEADRDTIIVTADSGFGTLQDMLGRRLSLEDYMSLRLGTLPLKNADRYVSGDMASQRYTSMTDLETAVALSHLSEVVANRLSIRFARDLRMEDLKDNNVILVGSAYTNPWTELFEKNLNFELHGDVGTHTWRILNRHPLPGEAKEYEGERDGASHQTYASVAWVPNMDANGHVLMLQGLDMAGTQAAAQSLLHSDALASVWQRSSGCRSARASFEVLLGTTSIGSSAGTIQVLATRLTC